MPGFLVPLIAAAAPSIFGAIFGRKKGGGDDGSQGNARQLLPLSPDETGSLARQNEFADMFGGFSRTLFDRSNDYTDQAAAFARKLMESDPATLAAFFAPEIERGQRTRQAGVSSIERNLPRGGERDRAMSNFISGNTGDYARLFAGARPAGAKMFTDLAGITSPAALGYAGTAVQAGQGPLSFLASRRASDVGFRQQDMDRDMSFGQGIGGLIGQLLPLLFNKGGGGLSDLPINDV